MVVRQNGNITNDYLWSDYTMLIFPGNTMTKRETLVTNPVETLYGSYQEDTLLWSVDVLV